jgi:hypothetical protein
MEGNFIGCKIGFGVPEKLTGYNELDEEVYRLKFAVSRT